jgi:hypothetical protein
MSFDTFDSLHVHNDHDGYHKNACYDDRNFVRHGALYAAFPQTLQINLQKNSSNFLPS